MPDAKARTGLITALVTLLAAIISLASIISLAALSGCSAGEGANDVELPLTGLRVTDVLGDNADTGFRRAEEVIAFEFPRDHGKHPDFRSEWWYVTARLHTASGRSFGLQFTLFRQSLVPSALGSSPWQQGQAYLGHFALTDVETGRHFADQRFARGHPSNADVTLAPLLRAHIDDWSMVGHAGEAQFALDLTASGQDQDAPDRAPFAIELRLSSDDDPVKQGEDGLSHKGPGQASYYYSMPRLAAVGQISVAGQIHQVTGLAWLDREWSTSVLADGVTGWDWVSLHLHDARSIMAFRLRREDGRRDAYDHGLVVRESQTRLLRVEDFTFEPVRYWVDERGARWPIDWILHLNSTESLHIAAVVDDQLMRLGLRYWEGLVEVSDPQGQQLGFGYLELTGYDQGG